MNRFDSLAPARLALRAACCSLPEPPPLRLRGLGCAGDQPKAAPHLQRGEADVYLTVNLQGGIIFYHEDGEHR